MQKSSVPQWDWLSAGLLFVLLQVAAARLITTDWAPFLQFTATLSAVGVILGFAFGASHFGRRALMGLAAGYSAILLPWQLTRSVTDELLLDRLMHVGGILLVSLNQFLRRDPVKDPLFFLFFVCTTFWLISVSAGYWLVRHGRILNSIILTGAVIINIQAYANYQPRGSWWLAIYCLIALLLVGRIYYLQSQRDWHEHRVFVGDDSWPNILGSLLTVVATAILIAWMLPTSPASLRAASESWNSFVRPIRERLSNAVTSLKGPHGRPGSNFYGTRLAIGRSAASGDTAVLSVEILQAPSTPTRYYWRGRAYNEYTNGQWSSTGASTLFFQPEQGDLGIPDAGNRSTTLLRITSQFLTQSLIYAPAPTVWLDRPAYVGAIRADSELYDALSWEARTALLGGEGYEVKAGIKAPSIEQLRAAGTAYPPWIKESYLEVPARFLPDLQAVSNKVIAGKENVFDQASAITDYLRTNLEYSTTVPEPPEGQDPVMWVLLNHKKGFCNYYASAEVLLLRSVGIPARLAVGFARGELQGVTYTVRRRDAHAWPEVYFPGIGWLEFEPTANQDPLIRPSAMTQSNGNTFNLPPARPMEGEEESRPRAAESPTSVKILPFTETVFGQASIIIVSLLSAGVLIYFGHRFRIPNRLNVFLSRTLAESGWRAPNWILSWRRWNQIQAVERHFAIVNWSLRWLGKPQSVDATPAERAHALSKLLPAATEHIDALQLELESGLYSQRGANLSRARRASLFLLLHGLLALVQSKIKFSSDRDVY